MDKSKFNGDRLRDARRFRSLTITEVADKVNVSKQMISKYERKLAVPSTEVLFSLIGLLKFPSGYFFGKDSFKVTSPGTFFRSRLTATQREKTPSEFFKNYSVIIRDYLGEYIDFPQLQEYQIEGKSPEDSAKQLRNIWNLGKDPIPNMVELLERRGFVLSNVAGDSDKVDAFSSPVRIEDEDGNNGRQYYTILVEGTNYSFFRQQFSLAHELGHWLLHSSEIEPQDISSIEYRRMEQEANNFASEFLLPEDTFGLDIKESPEDLDLYVSLKNKWMVSIAMMVVRAKVLGFLTPDEYVNMQRRISYKKWRKVEPYDLTKEISKPQALKQSIELLVENDVISADKIKNDIANKYNILLPNEIIAEICGVDVAYLNEKSENIVSISDLKSRSS